LYGKRSSFQAGILACDCINYWLQPIVMPSVIFPKYLISAESKSAILARHLALAETEIMVDL